jgi:hypothetical protein
MSWQDTNNWASLKKVIHFLATMEGQASVLHGIPIEATYEALESHYRNHHLALVHASWLKARTQLGELVQCILVELPEHYFCKDAVHTFVSAIRGQDMKRQLFMGGLNQTLQLEAAKMSAATSECQGNLEEPGNHN